MVDECDTVLGNVNVYIMRGTNVLEREKTSQECGVSGVLALSYDDLKLCFLYLAQYPEDHEIQVTRLTKLWIAEGFIPSTSEIHGSIELMEDVSYGCLTELVQRSMVQVGKYGFSGKVKSCRLHDLMRDLCLQKAKEENFLAIVNFSVGPVSNAALIGKVRRLALYLDENVKYEFSSENGRDGHIRSLLYFAPEWFYPKWNKRIVRSVFNDFNLIRALKFENICREFELPKTIGNLVHLRFLSLKNSAFRGLPSSVSNLVLLQTLDLRGLIIGHGYRFGITWDRDTKIRNVFWSMEQLRHLYLPFRYSVRGKLSFARLCNLQTLVNVRIEKCDLNGLVQLSNLKKLRTRPLPYGSADRAKLKDDPIEILQKLPNLRVLYLDSLSFESETMVFSQGGFPHLEFLTLRWLVDLKEWRVEKEAMPSLQRLRIVWCRELRAVPDGLQEITTLKELTIDGMRCPIDSAVGLGKEERISTKSNMCLLL